MGDFAKGIKSFKKNMAEDDASMEATAERPSGTIAGPGTTGTPASTAARESAVNRG
jgi:sec-independent protein translocase protein TatA